MSTVPREVTLNKLHTGQQSVYDNRQRFNTLSCGRRWGKSKLAENILAEACIKGQYAAYFAPSYKFLNETYRTVENTLESIIKKANYTEKSIHLITGGILDFWTLENPRSGRGRKYHVAVVDEAAFVRDLETMWNENIRPTLTDFKGTAWIMSTPKGKNDFYRYFMKGKGGEQNWASFQRSTYDNPGLDPAEIDDAKREIPELAFSQEYLAEFNENVANPFGIAFIRQCTYAMSDKPAVCYGIDLAKSQDWTVIIGLDKGGQVCYFDRFQQDWRQTLQAIMRLPDVSTCIDSTGVGDPITEEVARLKQHTKGFKFSSSSKQQLMEGLAMAIQERKIVFPEGLIVDELSNFEYEYTRTGVKYSAPAGLHDDCVMALGLAWSCFRESLGKGKYSVI